jgi:hypothetical protein
MLSGNGRHRRPRQAPALLVAAGVTGSAIAIPLLAASGASAASGTTWDRVAECESGSAWSANTGNGYYGGLQLTQEDWEKYGGLAYAPSADQASRSQQIAVGEKVLADQGAGAWEACALLSGLGKDAGSANVDTGVVGGDTSASGSGSASESGSGLGMGLGSGSESGSDSDSDSSSSSSSASPTPSVSPSTDSASSADSSVSGKSSESSQSPSPSVAATTDSVDSAGSVASPSPSSSSPSAGDSQESDSSPIGATKGEEQGNSGQSAGNELGGTDTGTSAGTGRHRGDAEGSYTVRTGDTLWNIADSLGLADGWSGLFAENEHSVGSDPDLILPGQTLVVGEELGQK